MKNTDKKKSCSDLVSNHNRCSPCGTRPCRIFPRKAITHKHVQVATRPKGVCARALFSPLQFQCHDYRISCIRDYSLLRIKKLWFKHRFVLFFKYFTSYLKQDTLLSFGPVYSIPLVCLQGFQAHYDEPTGPIHSSIFVKNPLLECSILLPQCGLGTLQTAAQQTPGALLPCFPCPAPSSFLDYSLLLLKSTLK